MVEYIDVLPTMFAYTIADDDGNKVVKQNFKQNEIIITKQHLKNMDLFVCCLTAHQH